MLKAAEARNVQNYSRVYRCMEFMLSQKILVAAKSGYSKMELRLFDFDHLEKEVIKQLLKEGGYKFHMEDWDDYVTIEW